MFGRLCVRSGTRLHLPTLVLQRRAHLLTRKKQHTLTLTLADCPITGRARPACVFRQLHFV